MGGYIYTIIEILTYRNTCILKAHNTWEDINMSNNMSNKKTVKPDNKIKLQLSVNQDTRKTAKFMALKHDTTVSALFEDFIKACNKNPKLVDLIKDSLK